MCQYAKGYPFAPATDQSWLNFLFWNELGGEKVESTNGLVDPYDTADGSFNEWMLGGDSGVMPDEMSPTRYQMYTQSSNPEATRLGYKLFSPGPKDHGIKDVPLFQNDPLFWALQYSQAATPTGALSNAMFHQYNYYLRSLYPQPYHPGVNYLAYNTGRKKRSTKRK